MGVKMMFLTKTKNILVFDMKSFSQLQFDPLVGKDWRPAPEEGGAWLRLQPDHQEQEGFPQS